MTLDSVPALQVEDVSVALGGRKVLDEVTFSLAPGSVTGLIGSNGSGKTTLFRTILGFQKTQGAILLNGTPLSRKNNLLSYVPQKFVLDSDVPLRARDLVGLGIDSQRWGIPLPSKERTEKINRMLNAVGAEKFSNSRVGKLSGGEQQRVLIAHALISSPRLILLDEPLANLDLKSSHEVVGLLRKISKEFNVSVLVSAHEINALLPALDGVVYLAQGRAVEGRVDEVVRSDVLTQLYGHHVDVLNVHGRILVIAATSQENISHVGSPIELLT
jgi:zinc/manganese transport system ATP-binding protein